MSARNDRAAEAGTSGRLVLRAVVDAGVAAGLAAVLGGVYYLDSRTSPIAPTLPPPVATALEIPAAPAPPPPPPPPPPPDPTPRTVDSTPRVLLRTVPDGRFGLVCLMGHPDDPSDDGKRLTFSPDGETNNTRVMVDGRAPMFGDSEGRIVEPWHDVPDGSRVIAWSFRDVVVHQGVRLVPGDVSGRLDTVRVTYELKNAGSTTREVGLRVMLDTLIGDNDGVPFIVPGREGIVMRPLAMRGDEVPAFVRSLERNQLANPGVIVDLNLAPAADEVRPDEVLLSHWPGRTAPWGYNRDTPFGDDTAAGLYYLPTPLEPGRMRTIGFGYGLGTISSTTTRNARLSLTAGGPFRAGSSFWLVALVDHPRRGQTVRLTLPEGLTPRRPASASQAVEGSGDYAPLSWLVDIATGVSGEVRVEATLDPGGITERQSLKVPPPDVRLTLLARGPVRAGRPFWVSALVQSPREGQSVDLTLPDGVAFAEGYAPSLAVRGGAAGGYDQLNWLVVPGRRVAGRREIAARLSPDGIVGGAVVDIEVPAGDLTH